MTRNVKPALSAVIISVGSLMAAAGTLHAQPWVARRGLTPVQYQTAFDDFTKQGTVCNR